MKEASQLLEQFSYLVEAPGAIARLRTFALSLGIRGYLTPPATKKHARSLNAEDAPFRVPGHWTWAHLADVAECRLGKMLDRAKNSGVPRRYLRNVNVRWFGFDLTDVLSMPFTQKELVELSLRSGDVLACEGGEPGRAAVWDGREADLYFQKAIHRIRLQSSVDPHYLVKVLKLFADTGELDRYFTGTTFKHLTGQSLASLMFPLPPLAEQHRIVAKVDELMALCDQLEAAQEERERRRSRLLDARLHALLAEAPVHALTTAN